MEDLGKSSPDGSLTGRVAAPLDVGRILKQRQHILFAVLGKRVQIEKLVVGWRRVNLEITGMNNDANRRVYRERNAIYERVRDLHRVYRENADLESLSGANLVQHRVIQQAVFFQLPFYIGEGKLRPIDRHVEFAEHPWQRANMVFVAMRENDSPYFFAVLDEVANIGHHDIDAEELGLRKHHPGINHNDVVAIAYGHAVHAEFAETT